MGTATLKQGKHLLSLVENLDTETLQEFFKRGHVADLLSLDPLDLPDRNEFRKFLGIELSEYDLTVDHQLSLARAVEEGQYNWISSLFTPRQFNWLVATGSEALKGKLVGGRWKDMNGALDLLKKKRLRPATLRELLAFGAAFPDVQKKLNIVALGEKGSVYPFLSYDEDERRTLDIGWDIISCTHNDRLLAFPV